MSLGLDNIPPDELEAVKKTVNTFEDALTIAENPDRRTKATVKAKNDARKVAEKASRGFIKANLTNNRKLTDADREKIGLPVHDTNPTPAPDIVSRPEIEIRFHNLQEHVLVVHDSATGSAARPAHAIGFEIWRKVGEPAPAIDSDWLLVVQALHSPHTLHYTQAESNLRAYYRVRWVNSRGVPGPWSETQSAIIP
jgi:hypothetical protein